jgi:FkbM family methyltransferase
MASFKKLYALAVSPKTWSALSHGVAPTVEHEAALGRLQFASVIDIGANKGQFASFCMGRWPQADLYCFEPLPAERAKLEKVVPKARVYGCALGPEAGEALLHVATRADSSSLLPLDDLQKSLFNMDEKETLTVDVRRLDAVIEPGLLKRPALLKIDVQGYELEVLKGAGALLDVIDAAFIEVSFAPLYRGQAEPSDIIAFLARHGLQMAGNFNQTNDADDRAVQADFLFLRRAQA